MRGLELPWWLRLWRWLRGLFRRPPTPAKPSTSTALRHPESLPARPPPDLGLRPLHQVPATKKDIKRLGEKTAVAIALGENAKRIQRATIRASDGELYVVYPGGTMVKTNGSAAARPNGTLIPLPPEPRPTKRERAKAKRRLKRKEK